MIWEVLIIVIVAALLVLMGRTFVKGKADELIAGYNTASPQKRKLYDIVRLRKVVAMFLYVLAGLFFLNLFNSDLAHIIFLSCLAVLIVVTLILANSWAKKKSE